MLSSLRRRILRGLKWCLAGEQFRRYAPHNSAPRTPASQSGPPLRIGIVFLIPLLGDAVLLLPLIDALRAHNPTAEITVFAAGAGKVLGLHPAVDRLYLRPPRNRLFARLWPLADIASLWLWWLRSLRSVSLDVAVLPRAGSDPFYAPHLAWLLGAPLRVGYAAALEPERLHHDIDGSALLTREVTRLNAVHEVERGSEILQLAGLISTPVDGARSSAGLLAIARRPEAIELLAAHPELSQPFFILSPGASVPRKEWPEPNYAAVARHLAQARGWLPVIVGGPEVHPAGARIAAGLKCRVLNLGGQTTFPQLAAVCARAQLFVGNDSGTGHVAGAVGTPAVILSSYAASNPRIHQTSPARTHPSGPWHAIVQPAHPLPPCAGECLADTPHCITQIPVGDVLAACDALLEASAEVPSATR